LENAVEKKKFETWGVLELIGHLTIAGRISEEEVFGAMLCRVDVPAVNGIDAYTRYFGQSSIYSVSPTTEETATAVAMRNSPTPVATFDARRMLETLDNSRALPAARRGDPDIEDDEEDEDDPNNTEDLGLTGVDDHL
jgi:hypothetical protein